jgi:hypothetical protein
MSHKSDCATHNAPALPKGTCDCGVALSLFVDLAKAVRGAFSSDTGEFNSRTSEHGTLELREMAIEALKSLKGN